MGGGAETKEEEEEEYDEEGDRGRETPRGEQVDIVRVGGTCPPLEENVDLPDFTS